MTISLHLDTASIARASNLFHAAGKNAPLALIRAVNHTGDKARTQMRRALVSQTGLTMTTIRKAVTSERSDQQRGVTDARPLGQAAEIVHAQLPDLEPSFVELPDSAYGQISVGGRGAYPLLFERVEVNPYNGKVERTRRVSDHSALELVTGSMRPLHTGDFAGVWLKLIYLLFGLTLTTLVFSGMMVWTRRTALETVKLVRYRMSGRLELEAAE